MSDRLLYLVKCFAVAVPFLVAAAISVHVFVEPHHADLTSNADDQQLSHIEAKLEAVDDLATINAGTIADLDIGAIYDKLGELAAHDHPEIEEELIRIRDQLPCTNTECPDSPVHIPVENPLTRICCD